MGRPPGYQWRPLSLDTDPVPGVPSAVSQEAAHLASVANEIRGQVEALHQIGQGGAAFALLEGQYADKIQSAATDLAGQLDKVVGRYQQVSSALSAYVPDLEQAQAWSLQALNQAEGPYQQQQSLQAQTMPSGSNLTAAQQQQISAHRTALTQAADSLNAAHALLTRATQLRDQAASTCKNKINSAIQDGVKDSWWDDWSGVFADIATVLEWIGTALAILALFIPGLDILVILGFAATFAALVLRSILAATGKGSWVEVALDAFACLTFGLGHFAIAGKLVDLVSDSKGIAQGLIDAERDATVLGKVANVFDSFSDFMGSKVLPKIADSALSDLLLKPGIKVTALAKGLGAGLDEFVTPGVAKTLESVSEDTTFWERVIGGGEQEPVLLSRQMAAIADRFGSVSPEIASNAEQVTSLLNTLRVNFGAATSVDLTDHTLTGIEWQGPDGSPVVDLHIPGIGDWWSGVKDWATPGSGL